jgi:hypothetical protein
VKENTARSLRSLKKRQASQQERKRILLYIYKTTWKYIIWKYSIYTDEERRSKISGDRESIR